MRAAVWPVALAVLNQFSAGSQVEAGAEPVSQGMSEEHVPPSACLCACVMFTCIHACGCVVHVCVHMHIQGPGRHALAAARGRLLGNARSVDCQPGARPPSNLLQV